MGAAPATDVLSGELPCWHDNRYDFQPPSTYVPQEGITKCNFEAPTTRTGNWALMPDG